MPTHFRSTSLLIKLSVLLITLIGSASGGAQQPGGSSWFALSGNILLAQVEVPASEPAATPAASDGINFFKLMLLGGWFMVPLLALSILVLTIAIERFLVLRRDKIFPPQLIEQLGILSRSPAGLDPRRAYQICQEFPSTAAYILRAILVKVGRPLSEIEHAVSEASQREANRLSRLTSWLSLAAAVAPLIGLLGTVWGITQAFHDTTQLAEIGAGQNRGAALANGIYVALVTTIAGLMIAIPAAVLSHFFENRIVQLLNEIEEMVCSLLPQFERYEGQVRFTSGELEQEIRRPESPNGKTEKRTPEIVARRAD